MSIIYWEKCEKHIDTDFDAEHEEEFGEEFCGNCCCVLEDYEADKAEYDGYVSKDLGIVINVSKAKTPADIDEPIIEKDDPPITKIGIGSHV